MFHQNPEPRIMAELLRQRCIPCTGDLPAASEAEISIYKSQIPEWDIIRVNDELHLQKVYHFHNFQSALAFTNLIGNIAEAEGHHPSLLTEWGKVTVTWWTHAINGLHHNDFIMAAKTDALKF